MRILVFSSPFEGHLNVLRKMMEKNSQHQYKLVITTWKNLQVNNVTNLQKSILRETDPALWTFKRVYELLEDCLKIVERFKPELIIYDFFSLEGKFVGDLLGIPAWCSIPAMMGPNDNKEYLNNKLVQKINVKYISKLERKYKIKVSGVEMVSDGFHIPGQVNLVWSYPELTPANFMYGRKSSEYEFVGNYNEGHNHNKEIIYFSLGTVVMNNLWNQQEDTRREVKNFINRVSQGLAGQRVLFVSQGKPVLDHVPLNWSIEDRVDQVEILSRSKVFITHGGSNSFHEAVLQKVPMVVIPFFGDQILVGKRVAELGIGINLGEDDSIDTKKSKDFLNDKLADKVVESVNDILRDEGFSTNLRRLELTKTEFSSIIGKHFPGRGTN